MILTLNRLTLEELESLTLEGYDELLISTAELGRRPIGINQQPGGGTVYPFIQPSEDVQQLLGDFYLSYEDDLCEFVQPFSVTWLYGFGTNVVAAPPGSPTPAHSYDLLVVDADGHTVFDSTAATVYYENAWSDRLLVIEWRTSTVVCRCTHYTVWSEADYAQGYARIYDLHIAPTDGRLDPRAANRVPRRLRSLRVGPTSITNSKVVFDSGYNVALTVVPEEEGYSDLALDVADLEETAKSVIPGSRVTTKLLVDATPGVGAGQSPGCNEDEPPLKLLNGVRPDTSGNFNLDMEGCLRAQRAVTLGSASPRTYYYRRDGLTDEEAQSAIVLNNDCGPCCDCDFFARTYKGLKRQWLLWDSLAARAEVVCNQLGDNVTRWNEAKACRAENAIRTVLIPEKGCKVAAGGSYCNNSRGCAAPLTLRFTFIYYRAGSPLVISGSACGDAQVAGSDLNVESSKVALGGSWPIFEYTFDYINPTDTARLGMRVCAPNCQPGDTLMVYVTAHYPDFVEGTTPAVADVPDELQDIWTSYGAEPIYPTRSFKASPMVPVDNTNPFCASCDCDWSEL